ncbi:MAG TPA: carboxyl transferase domain-containing protein [Actinophytocola sp.]|uniref:carboxyl transferase domain-containing protein n=1 Tax=Actinophytocola sp. TaxID=1872138 RepID=UPI002DB5726F|nr:carboxyl transferase domain-containing protein [Actinophytocola sp.]HEU5472166.1 carboxyl transferase domain-containing protein [Actinophytocola sp.]
MAEARAMIAAVTSAFTDFGPGKVSADPLGWPGYPAALAAATERTGERESVVCGRARIGDTEAVLIAFDFRFLGGSIGSATGAMLTNAFEAAVSAGLPVVSMLATGGSRMQEGMLALRQLQLVSAAAAALRAAGPPHVAVLCDPTTGGVWASLGAGADVVLGVAGAQVGFAGSRVRPVVFAQDPAYTAEGQLAAGAVDEVVDAATLRGVLGQWLALLGDLPAPRPAPVPRALGEAEPARDGWAAVLRARLAARPRASAYLDDYFELRRPVSGDRAGGVDPGMLCGIGRRDGQVIAYAAQAGTATTPAGFRTAARLIRLAGRLGLPVLTLVDTPGAAVDPGAERAGLGPAIASLFAAVAEVTVPVTTLVIGEGGSGGALALSAPDATWITPDGYFAVIAPELAAAILKRSAADVPATAGQLRLRPADLVELGVVRGIVTT